MTQNSNPLSPDFLDGSLVPQPGAKPSESEEKLDIYPSARGRSGRRAGRTRSDIKKKRRAIFLDEYKYGAIVTRASAKNMSFSSYMEDLIDRELSVRHSQSLRDIDLSGMEQSTQ